MTPKVTSINSFRGEYSFLSNFYPALIEYENLVYPSVEHAYQASKTLDRIVRGAFMSNIPPGQAKKLGRTVEMRPDWMDVRVPIMRDFLCLKFMYHPALRDKLVATGDIELVEGNKWGDRFWGVSGGKGENVLGKLLMEVRDIARKADWP